MRGCGGLVAFDMDGTLVKLESSWLLIHRAMGTESDAKINAERYYCGQISYDEWAKLDVALWMGRDFTPALRAVEAVEPVSGAREALEALRSAGLAVGVISSGLDLVLRRLESLLGFRFDFAVTNELLLDGSTLVGWKVNVPFHSKGDVLLRVTRRLDVPLSEVAVVGDAENDLSMFRLPVGLRVAFNPTSPELEREADVVIRSESLLDVAEAILDWCEDDRT
ncbi:MAG: hypothetical protein DRO01_03890 [Thermoproteota archaeon]|nr:MAG: hypothetical protein DRO01_03890 [Candidatus Korarchaeota archaeon]